MIGLQIYLTVTNGKENGLENAFKIAFAPAIKKQDGFAAVYMIKSTAGVRTYQINLYFNTEEQRLTWVASDDHQDAWPKIVANCDNAEWLLFDCIE